MVSVAKTVESDASLITAAVEDVVRKRIATVMDEEIAKAKVKVEERIRAELGTMACQACTYYSVQQGPRNEIIITIKNDVKV